MPDTIINLITAPDKLLNSNPSLLLVNPSDDLKTNFNGFLYEKNNSDDFKRKFIEIYEMSIKDNDKKNKVLLSGLRTSKQYTLYNHYKDISQHLSR